MRRVWIALAVASLVFPGYAGSISVSTNFGFHGFLDNREYFNSVQTPQTMFGARVAPGLAVCVDSNHFVTVGADLLTEFGSEYAIDDAGLTLFYQYLNQRMTFLFGSFPRADLLDYPLALLSDSLDYYRPHIEGTLLEVRGPWGHENIWADWTSRQTDSVRETFLCGFSGRLVYKFLFLDHHFLYYHRAGPGVRIPGDHIRDNGGAQVRAGARFALPKILDSLSISVGALGSYDRTRSTTEWSTPVGGVGQVHATIWKMAFTGLVYSGEEHVILWGDSFYRADSYGRVDIRFLPVQNKWITASLKLSLHVIEGHVDHSEVFGVTVNLKDDRTLWRKNATK